MLRFPHMIHRSTQVPQVDPMLMKHLLHFSYLLLILFLLLSALFFHVVSLLGVLDIVLNLRDHHLRDFFEIKFELLIQNESHRGNGLVD